jgi:hypothetical protein
VIQGSAVGPIAFILNATDLDTCTQGNKLHKYADDTYLLVPSCNTNSIPTELDHLTAWASDNNLKLNCSKSLEMVVKQPRSQTALPPSLPGIARVQSLNILGVTIQHDLSMACHISNLISGASQNLYALKTLKAHGLPPSELSNICRTTLIARLTYASPAWRGFARSTELTRLQGVLSKAVRWGLYDKNQPDLADINDKSDRQLFSRVLGCSAHVLHRILPPDKCHPYRLRKRMHSKVLPINTSSAARNFLHRMLFSTL